MEYLTGKMYNYEQFFIILFSALAAIVMLIGNELVVNELDILQTTK